MLCRPIDVCRAAVSALLFFGANVFAVQAITNVTLVTSAGNAKPQYTTTSTSGGINEKMTFDGTVQTVKTFSTAGGTWAQSGNNTVAVQRNMAMPLTAEMPDRNRVILFYSLTGNASVIGSTTLAGSNQSFTFSAPYVDTVESAFLANSFNVGIDNIFQNAGNTNSNNIERIDVRLGPFQIVNAADLAANGFPVFERGTGDQFKMLAIKGAAGSCTAPIFGATAPTISFPSTTAITGHAGRNVITSRLDPGTDTVMRPHQELNQNIVGLVASLSDVGFAIGDTVCGYSLLPTDAVSPFDPASAPANTNAAGGLDPVTVTGLYKLSTVTVNKVTSGAVGGPFTFTSNNTADAFTAVTTDAVGTPKTAGFVKLTAAAPTTVTEAAVAGFALTDITCTGLGAGGSQTSTINAGGAGGKVVLDSLAVNSANVVCTFTNAKLPTLTLTKTSNGGAGGFTFTGDNGWTSQTITTAAAGTGVSGATQVLGAANTVTTITESAATGYVVTDMICTGIGAANNATYDLVNRSITLSAAATTVGAAISCSVTNTKQADMQSSTTAPASALAGQSVTVSGTCTNAGPSAADTPTCALSGLPAGATQSCLPSPTPTSLPAGQWMTCSSTFTVPNSGTLNITTAAGAATTDLVAANNTMTKPLNIIPQADMQVVVSGFPATANAGTSVSGLVTCRNNGPSAASNASCVPSGLPVGATVNCPVPANPLGVGGVIACNVSFVVPVAGGVTVTGTASTSTADSVTTNNQAQQSVGVVAQADMQAGTSVPAGATAGQSVTVSGTCTNAGPSSATAATCALGGLPAGATQSCTPASPASSLALNAVITCTSTFNAPVSGTLNISTNAGTSTADPVPNNNTAAKSLTISPQADLQATVSGFPASANAGTPVSGTVTCTNTGPSDAANVSCAVTGLPPGASVVCAPPSPVASLALNDKITCSVSFTAPASGTVNVRAAATTSTTDPVSANNTAGIDVSVTAQADMQATTTVPSNVKAGDTITVSGVCSNAGPSDAAAPTCALSGLPAGATQSCLPSTLPNPLTKGSSVTCTSSSFAAPATGPLNITTTAGTSTPDPVATNNANVAVLDIIPQADLEATVNDFPATADGGTAVTGTLVCKNNGPSPALNPTCSAFSLPTGATASCLPSPLPSVLAMGDSITCNVSFTAPNGQPTVVTITGKAGSDTADPTPGNNSAQQSVDVVPKADMKAVTTVPAVAPAAGTNVMVSGLCTNLGPSIATTPTCALSGLPPGASQSCTPSPLPSTLAMGDSISCSSTFITPSGGALSISTTAGSLTQDDVTANNAHTVPLGIALQADMGAKLSGFVSNLDAGSTATGTLTCTNGGPSMATSASCAISGLPAGATVSCVPASPVDSLAVGSSLVCNISYTVPASGAVNLSGTANSATTDPSGANNVDTATQTITPQADMRASTTMPASVTAG